MIAAARCATCGARWLQPVCGCASCGGRDLDPCSLAGSGEVIGVTTVHSAARTPSPWTLAQVRLDDGGVLVLGLADGPIERSERVTVRRVDDGVPVFSLDGSAP